MPESIDFIDFVEKTKINVYPIGVTVKINETLYCQ